MSDPVSDLKRELLAAAERQLGHAVRAPRSRRRWQRPVPQGRPRRRTKVLVLTAAVVIVGGASAFATVSGLVSDGPYVRGTQTRVVDGVPFSFTVPPRTVWENGPVIEDRPVILRNLGLFISKNTVGPQGAEAVIFWAGFNDRAQVTPCAKLLGSAVRGSTAEVAAAAARTPGTEVVTGPRRVRVGGRPATHIVLTLRRDRGCDPGFFFTWRPRGPRGQCWGACWLESSVGDTIRLWIVSVGGTRLAFQAVTKDPGDDLASEIAMVIASIRFL